MSNDFQDKIDDFVLNRMSEDDKIHFLKEIASDKEKQERFELTKDLCEAIKSRNEKLASIKNFCKENSIEQKHDYGKKKIIFWMSCVASIAAVIILGVFFIIPVINVSSDLSNNSHLAHVKQITPVIDTYSKSLHDIAKLLKEMKYEEALKLVMISEEHLKIERHKLSAKLENSRKLKVDGFKVNETNVFSNSKDSILNDILKSNCNVTSIEILEKYEYELAWLKINTLIGLNRIQEAKKILIDLRVIDGTYKLKADSLLNEIKK